MRFLCLILACTASLQAHAEQKTLSLPSAEDGNVAVVIDTDTHLPIGASDARARVTEAALTFLPKEPGAPLRWTWRYAIEFKPGTTVRSVTVEDERDHELKPILRDDKPTLAAGRWQGQETPQEMTKPFFEAMTGKDVWMLLRRISIQYEDGSTSKLHQLVIETQPMRQRMLDRILHAANDPQENGAGDGAAQQTK